MNDQKENINKNDIPKEELIKLPKSQVEQMMKRIEALEADKNFNTRAEKVKTNYAYIRRHEGNIVIDDIKNIRRAFVIDGGDNKIEKELCDLAVFKDGKTEILKGVDYLAFLKESEKEIVLLLERSIQEIEEEHGEVNKVNVKDYKPEVEGVVDNIVTTQKISYVVKFQDGKTMKLKSNALNI